MTAPPAAWAGLLAGLHRKKDSSLGKVEELVRAYLRQIGVGRARGQKPPRLGQMRAGNDGRKQCDTLWVVDHWVLGLQ